MLTDTQKSKVRLYMGWPDAFRDNYTALESMFDTLSPEAEVQIAEIIAKLELVDTALVDAGITGAGLKRVDEIWFDNGWRRASEVRKTGRMYAGRLSIVMGSPLGADYFGRFGWSVGGGGHFPLG